MKNKTAILASLATLSVLMTPLSNAATHRWALNAALGDGATVNGYFDFDPDTSSSTNVVLTSFDITVSAPTPGILPSYDCNLPASVFVPFEFTSSNSEGMGVASGGATGFPPESAFNFVSNAPFVAVTVPPPCGLGTPDSRTLVLVFVLNTPLADATTASTINVGTIPMGNGVGPASYECINCEPYITFVSGTVSPISGPPPSPLEITTPSLPPGQALSATAVGVQYSAQLAATGGAPPYQGWVESGLPPGLNVNTATGLISGSITSPVPDAYSVNVDVSDTSGNVAPGVTLELATYCGNPNASPPGDDRDVLISEYQTSPLGVPVFLNMGPPPFPGSKYQLPHCDQITDSYDELNVGSPNCPPTPGAPLIVAVDFPPALAAWQRAIGRSALTSAYRSPSVQACAGVAKTSQHMFGDAADLPSIGKITTTCQQFTPVKQQDAVCKDIHLMDKRALAAGFKWTETWQPTWYPCQPGHAKFQDCVHADMRGATSGYVNP